jgi:hypothetical protein
MADVSWRRTAGIVLTPVVCAALLVLGVIAFVLGLRVTGDNVIDNASVDYGYLLVAVIVIVLASVAAYRIAERLWVRGWWTVVAALVPAGAFAFLQSGEGFGKREAGLVWLAGLAVALVVAALLAHRGLVRAAWIFGVLAAVAVADIAVIVQLMPSTGVAVDPAETLDRTYAPLWILFALINYDFGLDPLSWHIGDSLDLREVGYPLYALIALGFVVRAMRRDPAPTGEPAPPAPAQPGAVEAGVRGDGTSS